MYCSSLSVKQGLYLITILRRIPEEKLISLCGRTSVIPIEVKAEENLRAKSLRAFCDKYNPDYAVRTSMSDYREHGLDD